MAALKILLLESIHPIADELLAAEGFEVQRIDGSLKEDQLCARLAGVLCLERAPRGSWHGLGARWASSWVTVRADAREKRRQTGEGW